MAKYFLGSDIYVNTRGDQAVVLDLRSQQYLALDCRNSPSLLEALSSAASVGKREIQIDDSSAQDAEAISLLLKRGIVAPATGIERGTRQLNTAPTRSLVSLPVLKHERLQLQAIARFMMSFLHARLRLNFFGLKSIITGFQSSSSTSNHNWTSFDLAALAKVVRAFCRIRPWIYTAHGQCLFDSIVLTNFLRRYGYPVHLVIGTQPMPFSAHAWVQLNDCVVDDTVESVQLYEAILVA